jgi:hypothetical protein
MDPVLFKLFVPYNKDGETQAAKMKHSYQQ